MAAEHGDGQLDALLDRAVDAVNSGRLDDARRLAHEARALDHDNADVDDLLTGPPDSGGVLRRPTIMFCDLVGSTALSSRHDPEVYRRIVGRYKETCREILERTYGGRIMAVKGDGVLALFGYPVAHEDDAGRAVLRRARTARRHPRAVGTRGARGRRATVGARRRPSRVSRTSTPGRATCTAWP